MLEVIYCGLSCVVRRSSSVRRPSCVVLRVASNIALKPYYIPGPIDSKLGKKDRGDL